MHPVIVNAVAVAQQQDRRRVAEAHQQAKLARAHRRPVTRGPTARSARSTRPARSAWRTWMRRPSVPTRLPA